MAHAQIDTYMLSKLSALILRLWGWKIKGDYPRHLPKVLVIAIPHTSNWDFPVGILLRSAVKANIRFIGKSSLFRWPFGGLMRWMGGVPVQRSQRSHFVQTMVGVFDREKSFHTCIAPEGTRGKVDQLKSGFYHIAKGANVPIVMVRFDWGTKTLTWSEPYFVGDDLDAEIARIDAFFAGAVGRVPEKGYQYNS